MADHYEPDVYTVRVHEEDGSLWAEVIELPGLFAAGETMQELERSLREGFELYLETKIGHMELQEVDQVHHVEERKVLLEA